MEPLVAGTGKKFVRGDREPTCRASTPSRSAISLIRDAAYGAMPKAPRAELHERFADWLRRSLRTAILEQQEIVGFHLERAHHLLGELGPSDVRQ